MLNTAPHNTSVPQFRPSKENPIYPYITKRYPCQETYAGKVNHFRRLSWKIQQPDPNMVWSSVKLVLPLQMDLLSDDRQNAGQVVPTDARTSTRLALCNIALAETPMKAFRATSLTLNGKVFTEQNVWKDTLDACYRGVGPQAYGSNHSLQPVVTRAIVTRGSVQTLNRLGVPVNAYVRKSSVPGFNNVADNLDNNGPFIERARIFQQQLDDSGTRWTGDISSYLEIGPFQARARLGNTAVPYIEDFHLQMDFASQPSKFDQQCLNRYGFAPGDAARHMCPRLLEYATIPNYRPRGLAIPESQFLAAVNFTWTAKPYLEVTYTKFPEPMRPGYRLRCYERQYEKSLPEFTFDLTHGTRVHRPVQARITSRLLSYPTKIYLWGDQADSGKAPFIDGGCRRSCTLSNIHCRINQRPSVIDDPSQEDLFEMFQRHTNSDLEFASWRKAPVYCFTPADLGQPDLHANDARLTWFEFDASLSLTDLQLREQQDKEYAPYMSPSGYDFKFLPTVWELGQAVWANSMAYGRPTVHIDTGVTTRFTQQNLTPQILVETSWASSSNLKKGAVLPVEIGRELVGQNLVLGPNFNTGTGHPVANLADMDVRVNTITNVSQKFRGLIFAAVNINAADGGFGTVRNGAIFWCPQSFALTGMNNIAAGDAPIINDFSQLSAGMTQGPPNAQGFVVDAYPQVSNPAGIISWTGRIAATDAIAVAGNQAANDRIGTTIAAAAGGGTHALPGFCAYRVHALGLLNCNAAHTAWARAFREGEDEWNEIDETGSNYRWCAFSIDQDLYEQRTIPLAAGGTTEMKQLLPILTNYDLQAGVRVPAGRGRHQISFTTTSTYGNVDAVNNVNGALNDMIAGFYDYGGAANYGAGTVRQNPVFEAVQYERDAVPVPTEYQMKVLYEFGNCQYEFVRGAAPVRVIPNLVPVGPSPGLPMLE